VGALRVPGTGLVGGPWHVRGKEGLHVGFPAHISPSELSTAQSHDRSQPVRRPLRSAFCTFRPTIVSTRRSEFTTLKARDANRACMLPMRLDFDTHIWTVRGLFGNRRTPASGDVAGEQWPAHLNSLGTPLLRTNSQPDASDSLDGVSALARGDLIIGEAQLSPPY